MEAFNGILTCPEFDRVENNGISENRQTINWREGNKQETKLIRPFICLGTMKIIKLIVLD